jgi:hypothetical protein
MLLRLACPWVVSAAAYMGGRCCGGHQASACVVPIALAAVLLVSSPQCWL